MLKDFDIAFTNKVRNWFSNTIYANTALVYNVAYNLVDDASVVLRFPLISIYRPEGLSLVENQNFAAKRQGIEYFYNEEDNENIMARFLTARLAYQLDIYAKSPEDLMDISEDIMQAFNFDPILEVSQANDKAGVNYVESYEITYNNGPVEQSEFTNDDRVYHYSIVYELMNARIVNFKTTKGIDTTTVNVEIGEEEI